MSEKGGSIEPGAIDATTLTGAACAAAKYLGWGGGTMDGTAFRQVNPPTDERELRCFHAALMTIFALCTTVPLSSVGAPLGPTVATVLVKPAGASEATPTEIRIAGPIDAYRDYASRVGLLADPPSPQPPVAA